MAPKGRKSLTNGWYNCESCGVALSHKDVPQHTDCCPLDVENWTHPFIKDNTLFSCVEYCDVNDALKFNPEEVWNVVYLSQSAMQLCNFEIGEKIVLITQDGKLFIRMVWPTTEKSLTSIVLPPSLQGGCQQLIDVKSQVRVQKITSKVIPACSIDVVTKECLELSVKDQLITLFKQLYIDKLIFIGQELAVPFYGKYILFKIKHIIGNYTNEDNLENKFDSLNLKEKINKEIYLVGCISKWNIVSTNTGGKMEESRSKEISLDMVGGYKDTIEELIKTTSLILKENSSSVELTSSLGILLHGASGTGKTFISRAVANKLNVNTIIINSGELFSKFYGEAENRLLNLFNEAKAKSPSIIIIDNIDSLCSKKGGTDQEKRVSTYFVSLLDSLRNYTVVVLSTTSNPNSVDNLLRRPGRLDFEVELPIPTVDDRFQILKILMLKWTIDEHEILKIANLAHGYVAADLTSLVNKALMHALSCKRNAETSDLYFALSQIKPSAMREVLVQVPDVRWHDIGGMDDIKLKLQQAIEWPLNHSDSFTRLGITPPCGVLMFGPPGCSKTMIAKAVATESNLNFISVKGSDLFSKWVGESEKAVQSLFKKARSVAPSIVFLDELDAIGGTRTASNEGSNVQERVLAQLLTEMDGVEPLKNVNIIAATNRPDRIDKALLRPGRLDRLVYVPLPDLNTRKSILQLQLAKMPVSTDISVDDLSLKTDGYSGAEVIAVCHEAAISALQENFNVNEICERHFVAALENLKPRTPESLLKLYELYLK